MTREERAYRVLTDPRFYQAEWVHSGHDGRCPFVHAWGTCRQFRIGVRTIDPNETALDRVARVRWLRAPSPEEALELVARVLFDGADITTLPGYDG